MNALCARGQTIGDRHPAGREANLPTSCAGLEPIWCGTRTEIAHTCGYEVPMMRAVLRSS